MTFVKAVRSVIFFLSVTALICFVLDHLLWPASGAAVVPKDRRHRWQRGSMEVGEECLRNPVSGRARSEPTCCRIAMVSSQKAGLNEWRKCVKCKALQGVPSRVAYIFSRDLQKRFPGSQCRARCVQHVIGCCAGLAIFLGWSRSSCQGTTAGNYCSGTAKHTVSRITSLLSRSHVLR
jgi:hypothetical protein